MFAPRPEGLEFLLELPRESTGNTGYQPHRLRGVDHWQYNHCLQLRMGVCASRKQSPAELQVIVAQAVADALARDRWLVVDEDEPAPSESAAAPGGWQLHLPVVPVPEAAVAGYPEHIHQDLPVRPADRVAPLEADDPRADPNYIHPQLGYNPFGYVAVKRRLRRRTKERFRAAVRRVIWLLWQRQAYARWGRLLQRYAACWDHLVRKEGEIRYLNKEVDKRDPRRKYKKAGPRGVLWRRR